MSKEKKKVEPHFVVGPSAPVHVALDGEDGQGFHLSRNVIRIYTGQNEEHFDIKLSTEGGIEITSGWNGIMVIPQVSNVVRLDTYKRRGIDMPSEGS